MFSYKKRLFYCDCINSPSYKGHYIKNNCKHKINYSALFLWTLTRIFSLEIFNPQEKYKYFCAIENNILEFYNNTITTKIRGRFFITNAVIIEDINNIYNYIFKYDYHNNDTYIQILNAFFQRMDTESVCKYHINIMDDEMAKMLATNGNEKVFELYFRLFPVLKNKIARIRLYEILIETNKTYDNLSLELAIIFC